MMWAVWLSCTASKVVEFVLSWCIYVCAYEGHRREETRGVVTLLKGPVYTFRNSRSGRNSSCLFSLQVPHLLTVIASSCEIRVTSCYNNTEKGIYLNRALIYWDQLFPLHDNVDYSFEIPLR